MEDCIDNYYTHKKKFKSYEKNFVFFAPIALILLAVMQQQTPNSNAHAMQSPAGGGALT